MFKFVIQFFVLLIFWLGNAKGKGNNFYSSSSVLIGIYVICSFMGIFALEMGDYTQPYESRYWIPMMFFDIVILLFLLPARSFRESSIEAMVLPSKRFLDFFSIAIILLSLFSIAFFLGSVRTIFTMPDLSEAKNLISGGENHYFETGTLATIASVAAANYVFAIILYFIYEILGGCKVKKKLLLISSLSEPIHVLAFVGRDGVVFWIFTFVFCFAFFRDYLCKSTQRKIAKSLTFVGVILLIPFLLISISRFALSEGSTGGSLISYLGHAFIEGPLFWGLENKPYTPGAGFPLFYSLLGENQPIYNGSEIIGDWVSYKFSTFIVSLYLSLGLGGLLVFLFGMLFFCFSSFGRAKKNINFSQFIIYLLYFQIVSQGVFYFRHYTRGGNLFIISTLFIAFICSLLRGAILLRKRIN